MSEEDLYDLGRGHTFSWSWPTEEDENVTINIKLFKGEDDLDEEEDRVEEILKDRDEAMQRFTNKLNEKG